MASTNHTTNYNLPQWVKTDAFKMEDFNDAFSKIDTQIKAAKDDAASAGNCSIATGSWTGNNTDSRTISLPWTPKFVIILGHFLNGSTVEKRILFLTQSGGYLTWGSYVGSISDKDACLSGAAIQLRNKNYHNRSGETVYYIALK